VLAAAHAPVTPSEPGPAVSFRKLTAQSNAAGARKVEAIPGDAALYFTARVVRYRARNRVTKKMKRMRAAGS
jgi:hypothetical protein